MLTAAQATEEILSTLWQPTTELIHFTQAQGRILAAPICADTPLPPFDRVMRDGIGIRYADYAAGQRQFRITGLQAAGSPALTVSESDTCVEIMTGAMCSHGIDTIIMYEEVEIVQGIATLRTGEVRQGQHIHRTGEDQAQGATLVAPYTRLGAAELGVAAAVGATQLTVFMRPRIALVSTGDELVPVEATPAPYQIRRSNVYALQALLAQEGLTADLIHLQDDYEGTVTALRQLLTDYDAILLSGGVSKGKLDFVPAALDALGVEKRFHRVQQRPGKPFWWGHTPDRRTFVFALPGNPVSTFMCAVRYFIPWYHRSMGLSLDPLTATLTEDFIFRKPLQYFLQVRLSANAAGQLLATPVTGNGSGDLSNLALADAFLELDADISHFSAGSSWPLYRFR